MKSKQARQASITRIANLFSLVPPFRIQAAGTIWSWGQPVTGPELVLCSYLPPRDQDWVEVDLPDGMIELRPYLTDPELQSREEELLQDIRYHLPEIMDAWAGTLADLGQLKVEVRPAGLWITVHPGKDRWQRSVWMDVDWYSLLGHWDPAPSNVMFPAEGSVVKLGTKEKNISLNLSEVVWPCVRAFRHAVPRVAAGGAAQVKTARHR